MSLLPIVLWLSLLQNYLIATVELFRFYFVHLPTFTNLLGDNVNFPEFLQRKKTKTDKMLSITVAKSLIRDYNLALLQLKDKLHQLFPNGDQLEFQTRMFFVFVVRFCTIIAAYKQASLTTIIAINLLQFIAAPFSLFVSTVYFFCYLLPMVLPHYTVNFTVNWLINSLISPSLVGYTVIPVNTVFIVSFLLLDQLICLTMSLVGLPGLKCQKFGFKEFFTHVWFGNLNCKTYFLLVFTVLHNYHCQLNIVVLLVDWYFGLTERLSQWVLIQTRMDSSALFYHMHRIGHLPTVYQQAHKLHHHLQGSNAFDAHHLYGSGLPEEWVELSVELLLSILAGLNPLLFNPVILVGSWENKIDHMKKLNGKGNNHHAYHHILHSKNFSNFGGLLDLVFDTHSKDDEIDLDGYLMQRSETDETVQISFTLVDDS